MRVKTSQTTFEAVEMVETLIDCMEDSHHWIGDNSIHLDKADTVAFIKSRVLTQKHLKTRYYDTEGRLCIDLGLSGRNYLNVDLTK